MVTPCPERGTFRSPVGGVWRAMVGGVWRATVVGECEGDGGGQG